MNKLIKLILLSVVTIFFVATNNIFASSHDSESTTVTATVQQALIFSIDNPTVAISANPTSNDGEDFSEKSVLTVSTNARNGYTLSAKLQGSRTSSAAQLDSTLTTSVIGSGNALASENTFGYIAYNGNGSVVEQPATNSGRAAMNNSVTRTAAQLEADATVATAFTNTNTIILPVTTTGNNLTPGSSSSQLGFDSLVNTAKHTIYYLLNIDFTIPGLAYGGVITYTATPSF